MINSLLFVWSTIKNMLQSLYISSFNKENYLIAFQRNFNILISFDLPFSIFIPLLIKMVVANNAIP